MGPIDLLVIQATPFCNLDCRYCYLPNRQVRRRISSETLQATFQTIFSSPFLGESLTVVWHAGEPLTLPVSFYEGALALAEEADHASCEVTHTFQTNGVPLDDQWCRFFKRHNARVGLSIDGPAFIHDRKRVTRSGRGTHRQVMEALRRLQQSGIDFYVIAVLTDASLDYPDEMFEFFLRHGIRALGLNVEEVEGTHHRSSLQTGEASVRFARFMRRFYARYREDPARIRVREFSNLESLVFFGDLDATPRGQQTTPYRIINVDCDGNFSTFSPELLEMRCEEYGDFHLGNVRRGSLQEGLTTEKFRAIHDDIRAGVELCRRTCEYFPVCGGGAPANKLSENGSFRSSETMFCRLYHQILPEVVLGGLEHTYGRGGSPGDGGGAAEAGGRALPSPLGRGE